MFEEVPHAGKSNIFRVIVKRGRLKDRTMVLKV